VGPVLVITLGPNAVVIPSSATPRSAEPVTSTSNFDERMVPAHTLCRNAPLARLRRQIDAAAGPATGRLPAAPSGRVCGGSV
jgi:hypothetical protein